MKRQSARNTKYKPGERIHKTLGSAKKILKSCREFDLRCKVTRVKGGYRVDKEW